MKSPNKLISGLIAGVTAISAAQAQQYTASPVYTAPVVSSDGQSATVSGTWSPEGIDPVNFQAIISLAYKSSSVYNIGTIQAGSTGTSDNFLYSLESLAPTHGDVVTLNIDYVNIDQSGPAENIVWDSEPTFNFNHAFDNDTADYFAAITPVDIQTITTEQSVFSPFSSTFTISGSDPTTDTIIDGTGGTKGATDSNLPTLTSDSLIFTSVKQGPSTWSATATEAVPEPSSAILLTLGASFMLRRKR